MSKFADKAIAHERRRAGETALSDFADYVEQQQRKRGNPTSGASVSRPSTAVGDSTEDHDELDILESLGLADETDNVKMKELLLGHTDENKKKLKELLDTRMDEGRGECLFDVGTENNGEAMGLTKEEYTKALQWVREIAKELKAGVTVLLTKGTGEVTDAEEGGKDGELQAKLLFRRMPDSMEDLLEIRVAVVGNGG